MILFTTVILCGLLQMVVGAVRLGVLIRMVPHSVMLGFVKLGHRDLQGLVR